MVCQPFFSPALHRLGRQTVCAALRLQQHLPVPRIFDLDHSTHSVKTGASLIRRQLNLRRTPQHQRQSILSTELSPAVHLGDLVAGYASDAQFQNGVAFPRYRSWENTPPYVARRLASTRRLTLNLGVRYEIFTPFTEVNGDISNFDTATGQVVSPILSGANHGSTANVKTDWGNISPRLGFAASLGRGMVLRGGFGLSYFPNQIGNAGVLQNVPLVVSRDCGGDSFYPVECPSAIAGPGGLGLTMARGLWQPTIDPADAAYPNEDDRNGGGGGDRN